MPTWINKQELADMLSVGKRSIDYLVKTKKLPPPVRISDRVPLWDLDKVNALMEKNRKKAEAEAKEKEKADQAKKNDDDDDIGDEVPDVQDVEEDVS